MAEFPDRMLLDGVWWAAAADEARRRTLPDPAAPMDGWVRMDVPGHWADFEDLDAVHGEVLHRCEFATDRPADTVRTWLVLEGIAGTADVWMDGALLGDTDAPYLAHTFEVTDLLARQAEHLLALDVSCPVRRNGSRRPVARRDLLGSMTAAGGGPAGGPWGAVRTERTGPVRAERLSVRCAAATHRRAEVRCAAVFDTLLPRTVTVRTTVRGGSGGTDGAGGDVVDERRVPLAAGENRVEWSVAVPEPRRWWPAPLGEPSTVVVEVAVVLGDDDPERGDDPVSHLVRRRTGLRTVERDPAGWRVNGERVRVEGTAVVDVDPPAGGVVGAAELADLSSGGARMLRVVGRPPSAALLDAADGAGLLVWADLPVVGRQHRTTTVRAVRQARRLVAATMHHPSVAVWCCHDRLVVGRDLLVGDRALARAVAVSDPGAPVLLRPPAGPDHPRPAPG